MEVRVDLVDEKGELQLTVKYLFVAKYNPNVLVSYEDDYINYRLLDEKSKKFELKQIPQIDLENDTDKAKAQLLYFEGISKQAQRIKHL